MKPIKIQVSELNFTFSRSSGAGGQNVNKVNSKVTLRWEIDASTAFSKDLIERFKKKFKSKISADGTVVLSCDTHRTQSRNIAECILKLEKMLQEVAVAPKKRRPTKPSKASIEKRLQSKKSQAAKKKERRGTKDY